MMDVKARTGEAIIPGRALFPWMVRHVGWSLTRFQPHGSRGQTSFESRTGTIYKSALVNFAETVMIRVPIDPPGLRKKLDTQWIKGTWVGRTDESDAHIVLTRDGVITGRSVRRLPPESRFQVDLLRGLKAKVSDPVMSQAKLLRILPVSVPIRLDGETEALEEAAELDARIPMEAEELVNQDAAEAVVLLPAQSVDMDVGAEELLGDAMATDTADTAGTAEEPPAQRRRIGLCRTTDSTAAAGWSGDYIPFSPAAEAANGRHPLRWVVTLVSPALPSVRASALRTSCRQCLLCNACSTRDGIVKQSIVSKPSFKI
jgi:hypothetical protein